MTVIQNGTHILFMGTVIICHFYFPPEKIWLHVLKQTNKQKTIDESPELLNVNNKSFICIRVPLVASFFSYSLKILNLIFILYCNTVDLQCVSFRCTAMCFTYTYTYIHSFSDSFSI